MKRTSILDLHKLKEENKKVVMLTGYNFAISNILEKTDIHAILVGDSLGMTSLGYDSTIPVTMEDMCSAVSAVARASKTKFIVADMPFLSYQVSCEKAVENAGKLIQAGAQAVKIEGADYIDTIKAIIKAGIPVMGHLGFTPQSVNKIGGFKVQGNSDEKAQILYNDIKELNEAGVFSIVLEMVPTDVAQKATELSNAITIGIGAGNQTDGQVLVTDDVIGLFDRFKPKFVKRYANIGIDIQNAVNEFAKDVCSGNFPDEEHSF